MPNLADLPPLPRPTTWLLAAALVCFWLAVRVGLVRRMEAAREPGEAPVRAWGWLVRLAHVSWVLRALVLVGLGLLLAAAAVAGLLPRP